MERALESQILVVNSLLEVPLLELLSRESRFLYEMLMRPAASSRAEVSRVAPSRVSRAAPRRTKPRLAAPSHAEPSRAPTSRAEPRQPSRSGPGGLIHPNSRSPASGGFMLYSNLVS